MRYSVIWTTILLAAALAAAPEEKDKLTFSHVRDTYGLLGPTRSADKFLPGGELFLCFDIEGVTIDDEGKVHYSIAVEVADPKGKLLFKTGAARPGGAGRARRRPHPGLLPTSTSACNRPLANTPSRSRSSICPRNAARN